ncbi:hypothetical protein G6016_16785 [Dietzia aerolata]|uniref:Uncharacterized protein n=2 Tax=Dietzia aerolata TaxID=595984 RepID=A0ABV5JQH8_9ACTN|nr:hypothetical protein [Dietzia aerolata]
MLTDPVTGTSWTARVDGSVFYSATGGRERTKDCGSAPAAAEKLAADTWTRLRSGYVHHDPDALPGTPSMLRHAGKGVGWLGRAALCAAGGDDLFFAVSHLGGVNRLRLIGPDGALTEVAELDGDRLVRSLSWHDGDVYVDLDGRVQRVDPATGAVVDVTDVRFTLGGSLRLAGHNAVWFDGRDGVVTDLSSGRELWRRGLEAGEWEGHTPMLALAVSTTGVAWCTDATTVYVADLASGAESAVAKRRSELTDELWLTEDGRLFTSGPYTGPARYTVATGEHVPVPTGADGTSGTAVADVAMDRDRTRVAVLTTDRRITVVDAGSLEVLASVEVEHMVAHGGCAFTGTGLAVSTDHGCFARYPLTG